MTIKVLLAEAASALSDAGVPDPVAQARDLLGIATGKEKVFIIAHPEHVPSKTEISRFSELVRRRASREPFQQIAGHQEFFGLDFLVTPDVMIPRPETELIVERGIGLLSKIATPSICEVGTGSGCIVVSLLHSLPEATAVGLEVSSPAREVTLANARSNGVADRLDLRESDVFSALVPEEQFDLIVSNPPYVPLEDIDSLQPEVRDHEPLVALTDGSTGLTIIERLVNEAPDHLQKGGHLLLEIGFDQSRRVLEMFKPRIWASAEAFADLQGIPRMIDASLAVG
ncbi:MAG: peptide chain release factor N(5)-glutamine methyltransferase [Acidobacteriota bacterium]|nr:MAG: peptide chain release factor N(5)-glutamine methyltransferase [Acidobacteriota bacterium]